MMTARMKTGGEPTLSATRFEKRRNNSYIKVLPTATVSNQHAIDREFCSDLQILHVCLGFGRGLEDLKERQAQRCHHRTARVNYGYSIAYKLPEVNQDEQDDICAQD